MAPPPVPTPPAAGLSAGMPSIQVRAMRVSPGLCESSAFADHGLSIHTGPPVWSVCRESRTQRRHLRVPGGINFVPTGGQSRWLIEAPMVALGVRVPTALMRAVAEDMALAGAQAQLAPRHQVRDPALERLGQVLHAELQDPHAAPEPLFLQSLNVAFCARLLSQFAGRAPAQPRLRTGLSPHQLARICAHIEAHLGEPGHEQLSLWALAALAGTSLSYFKAAFSQAMGQPVHRYIVQQRVERAATLLAQGRHSISEAALEAGFSHATHLARWTRRLLNVAPGELKKR